MKRVEACYYSKSCVGNHALNNYYVQPVLMILQMPVINHKIMLDQFIVLVKFKII
jgi:hypothetical protein